MKRFLVGTAGHIDHGKTALVKALTGIDADRLPEEKRRGITIDLGFAHAQWEDVRVSFVDVPGHERFVKNMLAGAGGIDAVLLVVAADESVMPQTREHFEIVRLLGITRGVVAISKIDRTEPDLVEVTRSDVAELVAGSFLETAAIVPVSARSGQGLEALKKALVALAAREETPSRERTSVRLPIDRAFPIAGFGPVVTGSLVSGTLFKDQKIELLPARVPVRVRRLEVHGQEAAEARAGERVSVNLAGIELSDVRRGLVLATPGAFATSSLLTVTLELLPGSPRIRTGGRVSFHHFSADAQARVRVLDGESIGPGESARAQLKLSGPIAAAPGDRFVLRRLSPVETVGGGVVLDPLLPRVSRRGLPAALDGLRHLEGSRAEKLLFWIEQSREAGAGEEDLAQRAGVPREEIRAAANDLAAQGGVLVLRRSPERYISRTALDRLAERSSAEIRRFLSESSGAIGAPRGTLLARLLPAADPRWAEAVEAALVTRGAYVVVGEEARLPGHQDLAGADRALSDRISDAFARRGLDPPSLADVAQEVNHKPKVVEGLAGYLVKKGALVRLPGGWLISKDAVDDVAARLRSSGRKSIDVGDFKEMFGLTRRLAIPLLEHLDATKVTRRVGDRREIVV